jgi:hypothetical protein
MKPCFESPSSCKSRLCHMRAEYLTTELKDSWTSIACNFYALRIGAVTPRFLGQAHLVSRTDMESSHKFRICALVFHSTRSAQQLSCAVHGDLAGANGDTQDRATPQISPSTFADNIVFAVSAVIWWRSGVNHCSMVDDNACNRQVAHRVKVHQETQAVWQRMAMRSNFAVRYWRYRRSELACIVAWLIIINRRG